jgi:ornithine decarboxylase
MKIENFRTSVVPLRRRAANVRRLLSVDAAVFAERPTVPMQCLRPETLAAEARRFTAAFGGIVLYAVKCNPEPAVLHALVGGGVRHFDCASLTEVRLVRRLFPEAGIHFMHPVKSRAAIREAYADHGVRTFVLDSAAELAKIRDETDFAPDLALVVRLALPKGGARLDLSGKFGAAPAEAACLLRAVRSAAAQVGVSFHVGSQCLDPSAYARAVALAGEVVAAAGVDLDIFDVGGGFPASYPDAEPAPLADYFAAIERAVVQLDLPGTCAVWCEPGRALVAAGQSVVVEVLGRRGDFLFINDGVYGALADAGSLNFRYPCRLIRNGRRSDGSGLAAFGLFGPTCDSADRMDGPFLLPADVAEGDWIEIGQLGAYGAVLRTGFNGFDQVLQIEVSDPPLVRTPDEGLEAAAAVCAA